MNDDSTEKWMLARLPGREEGQDRRYEFSIGPLAYIEEGKVYLHIPEKSPRDAEGRPRYPEQADWIRQVLAEREIDAKEIWWSHWEFESPTEAERFEQVLRQLGAEATVG